MKRTNRFLSILLALCLVLGMAPCAAFAANGSHPFTDVATNAWYSDAVQYVYEHDMMKGTGSTKFSPDIVATRGMIVTVLYRLEGTPSVSKAHFADVPAGQWYTDAVNWASTNDIVNGYPNGNFGPNDPITREQLVTILYRYAEHKRYGSKIVDDMAEYSDRDAISSYANKAMDWAVAFDIIDGTNQKKLEPAGRATRAQVAVILTRFCKYCVYRCTVAFDLNYDGAGIDCETYLVAGQGIPSLPVPNSRSGYTFDGWYTAPVGGSEFTAGTVVTADMTVYAHWSAVSSDGSGKS